MIVFTVTECAGSPGQACGYPSSGPGWRGFCQWTNNLWLGLLVLPAPGMVNSLCNVAEYVLVELSLIFVTFHMKGWMYNLHWGALHSNHFDIN